MKTLMTAADAAHLIEALYLAHCKARFHQGMQDLSDGVLLDTACAISREAFVGCHPDDPTRLAVQVGGRTHGWSLTCLNHEYLVQIAVVQRLLEVVEPAQVRVEYKDADVVVLAPGIVDAPPALLQLEIKTTRKGLQKDLRDADPGRPVGKRLRKIRPEWIVYCCADADAEDGYRLLIQRVVEGDAHGEAHPTNWASLHSLLNGEA